MLGVELVCAIENSSVSPTATVKVWVVSEQVAVLKFVATLFTVHVIVVALPLWNTVKVEASATVPPLWTKPLANRELTVHAAGL
jgi:hypothetical protein